MKRPLRRRLGIRGEPERVTKCVQSEAYFWPGCNKQPKQISARPENTQTLKVARRAVTADDAAPAADVYFENAAAALQRRGIARGFGL